jgi:hypothetical protein
MYWVILIDIQIVFFSNLQVKEENFMCWIVLKILLLTRYKTLVLSESRGNSLMNFYDFQM